MKKKEDEEKEQDDVVSRNGHSLISIGSSQQPRDFSKKSHEFGNSPSKIYFDHPEELLLQNGSMSEEIYFGQSDFGSSYHQSNPIFSAGLLTNQSAPLSLVLDSNAKVNHIRSENIDDQRGKSEIQNELEKESEGQRQVQDLQEPDQGEIQDHDSLSGSGSIEEASRISSVKHEQMDTEFMEMILNDEDNYFFEDGEGSEMESADRDK